MRSRVRAVVLLLFSAGVVAGCGSDSSSGSTSGPTVDLNAVNLTYSPTDLHAAVGAVTFVVVNNDGVEHNLTVETAKVNKDVEAHKTVKVKATLKAGSYAFPCEYHPDTMKGTIVVS